MQMTEGQMGKVARRARQVRIRTRIRHGVESLLVLALHAGVAGLIWLAAGKTMRVTDPQQIEVTVVDAEVLTLDLTDPEWTPDDADQTEESRDFAIPEPEVFAEVAAPEVEEFSAIPPVESPVVLSGFTLMDSSVSEAQLKRGAGGHFGFENCARGDLTGTMYDLKRNGSGQNRSVDFTCPCGGPVFPQGIEGVLSGAQAVVFVASAATVYSGGKRAGSVWGGQADGAAAMDRALHRTVPEPDGREVPVRWRF